MDRVDGFSHLQPEYEALEPFLTGNGLAVTQRGLAVVAIAQAAQRLLGVLAQLGGSMRMPRRSPSMRSGMQKASVGREVSAGLGTSRSGCRCG
jgi:hypothetical protein